MTTLRSLTDSLARHVTLDEAPPVFGPFALVGLGFLGFCLASILCVMVSGNRLASALPSPWLVLGCTGFVLTLARPSATLLSRTAIAAVPLAASAFVPGPWSTVGWAVALAVVWTPGVARVLATFFGLVAGGAWYAFAVALLPAHRAHGLEVARPFLLALPGVFLALGAELGRVRLLRDALAHELVRVPLVGRRAGERWSRLVRALERFPRSAERQRLWAQAREAAERVTERGRRLMEAELLVRGLDAEAARAELVELRERLEAEPDAATRALLARAAQVQSDALEQVEGFARQTRRLEASLRAAQSVLERIVTHVELTPAQPRELVGASVRVAQLLESEAAA